MQVYLQPATVDDEAAYFVTCVNVVCVMWGHTLSANHYPPENLDVYLIREQRDDVVFLYINLIRQDNLQAAAAVEQIYAVVGAPAALRAALILTIFRMEVQQNHWIPDMSVYAYLIRDYPEAVPLLEYALGCCLQAWGIRPLELAQLKVNEPDPSVAHAAPTS